MKRARVVCFCAATLCVGAAATHSLAQKAPADRQTTSATTARPAPPQTPTPKPAVSHPTTPAPDHNAVVKRYCVTCHNDARKPGGLTLASFDVAHAAQNAEVAEKMILKLRAGFM